MFPDEKTRRLAYRYLAGDTDLDISTRSRCSVKSLALEPVQVQTLPMEPAHPQAEPIEIIDILGVPSDTGKVFIARSVMNNRTIGVFAVNDLSSGEVFSESFYNRLGGVPSPLEGFGGICVRSTTGYSNCRIVNNKVATTKAVPAGFELLIEH